MVLSVSLLEVPKEGFTASWHEKYSYTPPCTSNGLGRSTHTCNLKGALFPCAGAIRINHKTASSMKIFHFTTWSTCNSVALPLWKLIISYLILLPHCTCTSLTMQYHKCPKVLPMTKLLILHNSGDSIDLRKMFWCMFGSRVI